MTAKNSEIINWENIFAQSTTFQTQKPTKWAFLEEFFMRDFYEKLCVYAFNAWWISASSYS